MTAPARQPRWSACIRKLRVDDRRALEILASASERIIRGPLLERGISIEDMVELANAGLVRAKRERRIVGRMPIEITRLSITKAGPVRLAPPRGLARAASSGASRYRTRAYAGCGAASWREDGAVASCRRSARYGSSSWPSTLPVARFTRWVCSHAGQRTASKTLSLSCAASSARKCT
jgi:hypothetical protein